MATSDPALLAVCEERHVQVVQRPPAGDDGRVRGPRKTFQPRPGVLAVLLAGVAGQDERDRVLVGRQRRKRAHLAYPLVVLAGPPALRLVEFGDRQASLAVQAADAAHGAFRSLQPGGCDRLKRIGGFSLAQWRTIPGGTFRQPPSCSGTACAA